MIEKGIVLKNMTIFGVLFMLCGQLVCMNQKDVEICSICLENSGCAVVFLPCGHQFCQECIDSWFAKQLQDEKLTTCPLCRQHPNAAQPPVFDDFLPLPASSVTPRVPVLSDWLKVALGARCTSGSPSSHCGQSPDLRQ